MALQLKLTVDSIAETGKSITLKDTTGTYEATTNAGGYGAPNAERNTLNFILLADYIKGSRRISATTVPDSTNGTIVSEWEVTTDHDCLYEFILAGAPAPVLTTTYNRHKVVLHEGKLYKALEDTTLADLAELLDCKKWSLITYCTDYPLLYNTGAEHTRTLYVHTEHTELCKAKTTLALSKAGITRMEHEELQKVWTWAQVNYEAARLNIGFGDFVEAGRSIEEAFITCSTGNCNC